MSDTISASDNTQSMTDISATFGKRAKEIYLIKGMSKGLPAQILSRHTFNIIALPLGSGLLNAKIAASTWCGFKSIFAERMELFSFSGSETGLFSVSLCARYVFKKSDMAILLSPQSARRGLLRGVQCFLMPYYACRAQYR